MFRIFVSASGWKLLSRIPDTSSELPRFLCLSWALSGPGLVPQVDPACVWMRVRPQGDPNPGGIWESWFKTPALPIDVDISH